MAVRKVTIITVVVMMCVVSAGCITPEQKESSTPTVEVVSVIDGDTVEVKDGAQTNTIRIYGIDTPEKGTRLSGTGEYGVPATESGAECLEREAMRAEQFAREKLLGEEVTLVAPQGENRGDFGRLLRYVKIGNKTYGSMALNNGLARVYDDQGGFSRLATYEQIERSSKVDRDGLWSCSAYSKQYGFAVFEVREDNVGSDVAAPTEFVEIGNTQDKKITLENLEISDSNGHTLRVQEKPVRQGEVVKVRTCESQTDTDIVWERCSGVWNNDGDIVTISVDGSPTLNLSY